MVLHNQLNAIKNIIEFVIDPRSYTHNLISYEIKAWKNSGLNGIKLCV